MKSTFRDVVMNLFPSKQVFMTQCPLLLPSSPKHELIVDFLYILHQPPPPDVQTLIFHFFFSFATYLWDKLIIKLARNRGASVIRIITDKPNHLPKPRELLHECRTSRTGIMSNHECDITDDGLLPHHSSYQQLLGNPDMKRNSSATSWTLHTKGMP